MTRITCMLATLIVVAVVSLAYGQAAPPAVTQPTERIPDQAELDRQFQETMTGAALIGQFTAGGRVGDREDRYVIQRVSKMEGPGDRWVIVWRAKVRGTEVPVPLVVPVKWAGDTPVISVTDMTIPGMGTYTARVIIYRDSYAGTWSGRARGGHLWGRIERASTTAPAATQPTMP